MTGDDDKGKTPIAAAPSAALPGPALALAGTLSAPSAAPFPALNIEAARAPLAPAPAPRPDIDIADRAAPHVVPPGAGALTFAGQCRSCALMIWRTFVDSIVRPVFRSAIIAALAFIVLGPIFAWRQFGSAVSAGSFAPLLQGAALQILGASVALGALVMCVRGLADYLFAGSEYLRSALVKFVPSDPAVLALYPPKTLRFYHAVLRLSGACAFVCELIFQTMAFGLITWGVAVAWPSAHLFENPAALNPGSAIAFWAERVFSLIDGPDTFGLQMSPLLPDKSVWPFGLAILFFKLGVISLVVRLMQDSIALKPSDISPAWADAIGRKG